MAQARTSITHPLEIGEVPSPSGGIVGVTLCPGKHQSGAMTGAWARDLQVDLRAIRDWGAGIVVTLVTGDELRELNVEGFGEAVAALGMTWLHLPIRDYSVPTLAWERQWAAESDAIHVVLNRGGRVLIHCKGGLGRAGTIASRVLIERGMAPDAAIEAIRRARPGAIETAEQAEYLRAIAPAQRAVKGAAGVIPRRASEGRQLAPSAPAVDAGVRDRAMGAFLGLAVGDALGTTLEFSARDSNPWHTEMMGGGPFRLPAGCWTDDTSMALALADSLASVGHLDERDFMERFVTWWRDGAYSPEGRCFDIGGTTRAALARFERTGDPIAGDAHPQSAGNGSLMRLSPVAVFYHHDAEKAREAARRQSSSTHGAAECLAACDFYAGLLVRAINGDTKDDLLAPSPWPEGGKVADIAAGGWRSKSRDQIRSSGYVIHSLEAALWAIHGAESFEEAVVTAVNLADDADTIGAITGQLAGAIWGAASIPDRWMDKLAWRDRLEAGAESLMVGGR